MHFLSRHEEFESRRPAPDQPYRRPSAVLHLPEAALEMTASLLRSYRCLEAACFWYGTRDAVDNGFVTAVVVPIQTNKWGNYRVSGKCVSAMSAATRPSGWLCLAQVHSHPGSFVQHSEYDNEHASSQRILSVVFPTYGHWNSEWPHGIGIHEFQNGFWHQLSLEDADQRVQLRRDCTQIAFLDLRK